MDIAGRWVNIRSACPELEVMRVCDIRHIGAGRPTPADLASVVKPLIVWIDITAPHIEEWAEEFAGYFMDAIS